MRLEVEALVLLAKGRRDAALAALEQGLPSPRRWHHRPAHPLGSTRSTSSTARCCSSSAGPSAPELFRASLERTPDRPLSLRGLARAQELAGETERASETWSRLLEIRENRDGAGDRGGASARWRPAGAPSAATSPPCGTRRRITPPGGSPPTIIVWSPMSRVRNFPRLPAPARRSRRSALETLRPSTQLERRSGIRRA